MGIVEAVHGDRPSLRARRLLLRRRRSERYAIRGAEQWLAAGRLTAVAANMFSLAPAAPRAWLRTRPQ
jgi:hypothetical protein